MSGVKPTSIKIEMDALDGGAVWVDISADVRNQNPTTAEYGIRSSNISKRVATGGNFSFALDNSLTNASTIRGWYSPDSASTREGFAVGTKTRLQIIGKKSVQEFLRKVGFSNNRHRNRIAKFFPELEKITSALQINC